MLMAVDSELAAPTRSWTACPPLGTARAEPLADGLWQPQRDGTPVDVLPLFELDREGRLACLDILAWPPGQPARVWPAYGHKREAERRRIRGIRIPPRAATAEPDAGELVGGRRHRPLHPGLTAEAGSAIGR